MKLQLKYLYTVIALFLMQSCGSSADTARIAETKALIESKEFEIQHDWLNPMSGGRINLIGNPNFIRFKKDSVNLFLPFFGERFSGGGYNSEGGIVYEGPLQDFEISSGKNNSQVLKFSTDQNTESLDFIINIYPEGDVSTRVNSSQRSFISYQGEIGELKENE
ncbi:DUF4251 domain-containing protein [Salegentibacter sp. LM13S]|uniref:DUF4251 domain-containing protein n=1 Tax=Salegentibacter lacus TaxID=2873599 RepID=UPI001CCCE75C|nr:DUF4251 domain-containing protein [Salegentibacter lacus]MBZ9631737.1 DUF4251 domain-containing protein [Salegentibacter lacus]